MRRIGAAASHALTPVTGGSVGGLKQEKCHFKIQYFVMKNATCLLKQQAPAYPAVISKSSS